MRFRIALFGVTGAALFILWLVFLLLPARKAQLELQARWSADQAQLTDYQTTLNQLPEYLKTRDDLKNRLEDVNSKLYSKDDILRLFDQLDARAATYALKVNEITPPVEELIKLNRTIPEPGKPQMLNVRIRLAGGYLAFGQFLCDLEQQPYFRSAGKCLIVDSPEDLGGLECALEFKALLGTNAEVL